jgi:hypothetical protein
MTTEKDDIAWRTVDSVALYYECGGAAEQIETRGVPASLNRKGRPAGVIPTRFSLDAQPAARYPISQHTASLHPFRPFDTARERDPDRVSAFLDTT